MYVNQSEAWSMSITIVWLQLLPAITPLRTHLYAYAAWWLVYTRHCGQWWTRQTVRELAAQAASPSLRRRVAAVHRDRPMVWLPCDITRPPDHPWQSDFVVETTARRYASAAYAIALCLSVFLSVCHKPVLYENG